MGERAKTIVPIVAAVTVLGSFLLIGLAAKGAEPDEEDEEGED